MTNETLAIAFLLMAAGLVGFMTGLAVSTPPLDDEDYERWNDHD